MSEIKGLENLRGLRQRAGLTQIDLAKALGVNRASIIAWEAGTAWPSAGKLPLIAGALNCSIDELYSDHNTIEEECPCREGAGICTPDTAKLPV